MEVDPAFSPDGKFIAYASSESGPEEIYVRPFPGSGGKWKISNAGGKFPVFARATRELFFLGGDDRIWVADYTIQDRAFSAGKPRVWSPTKVARAVRQNFDISADGKRAVVFPAAAETKQARSVPRIEENHRAIGGCQFDSIPSGRSATRPLLFGIAMARPVLSGLESLKPSQTAG